jgi:uncharacterized membrane protein YphA (DoxX/SURF4 family)
MRATYNSERRKTNIVLWTVQAILAALFVFAGIMKLITPAEALAAQSGMSGDFLHFIGLAELLGGIGLVAPGVTRIAVVLTPLAAAGLVIIMIGATVVSVPTGIMALIPATVGALAAFAGYGRTLIAPHRQRTGHPRRSTALQPAM